MVGARILQVRQNGDAEASPERRLAPAGILWGLNADLSGRTEDTRALPCVPVQVGTGAIRLGCAAKVEHERNPAPHPTELAGSGGIGNLRRMFSGEGRYPHPAIFTTQRGRPEFSLKIGRRRLATIRLNPVAKTNPKGATAEKKTYHMVTRAARESSAVIRGRL